jgi:hypothetical protein
MPDICAHAGGGWSYLQRRRRVRLRGGDRGRESIVDERLLIVLVRRIDDDGLMRDANNTAKKEWVNRNQKRAEKFVCPIKHNYRWNDGREFGFIQWGKAKRKLQRLAFDRMPSLIRWVLSREYLYWAVGA